MNFNSVSTLLSFLVLTAICGMNGCSAAEEPIKSKFCIPDGHLVSPPDWVPPNPSGVEEGLAFRGCRAFSSGDVPLCDLPGELIDGGIGPKARYPAHRWKDIPEDAFYRRVTTAPDSNLRLLDDGRTLVVSNLRIWRSWYIWSLAEPATTEKPLRLHDNDELAVVCETEGLVARPIDGKDFQFICHRNVQSKDYYLSYSFLSQDEVPKNLPSLDEKIIRAVDSWRCTK